MRLGIADHLGWAVAVTASSDHRVVDRRRLELIEPGLPAAPVHHVGGPHVVHAPATPLGDAELAALVADVRAAVVRATSAALVELAAGLPEPVQRAVDAVRARLAADPFAAPEAGDLVAAGLG
ncbi:MAG TPA: hypothetical protein VFT09_13860, partial [Ilumatobacteraceae bacterium]|nr:hypothetical protein [Ilumatobacteraceae bacterium]